MSYFIFIGGSAEMLARRVGLSSSVKQTEI